MSSTSRPRISIVVRSMGRLAALAELLERLLAQDHSSFEIVVIEQTLNPDEGALKRLETIWSDERIRVLRREPLGGPGARNEGARAARGDIVILVDDDDLPLATDWIATHEAAYNDPNLVGFTGRHVRMEGEACPYARPLRSFIRRRCLSYSFLKTPYTFARFDEDVKGVRWLHGTNSSFRKEVALRAGLWDTTVQTQDEHSFAFKLHRVLKSDEYLAFRTEPPLLRRLDLAGGMDKRRATVREELLNHLRFVHRVVRPNFPTRFRLAYPLYLVWALFRTLGWVWDGARSGLSWQGRLLHSIQAFRELPRAVAVVRKE